MNDYCMTLIKREFSPFTLENRMEDESTQQKANCDDMKKGGRHKRELRWYEKEMKKR